MQVVLHAVVAGLTSKLGGDSFAAGSMAGAVNEIMNGAISRYEKAHNKGLTPAEHQWLSAAVGAIVNSATGSTIQTGMADAVYATKWNALLLKDKTIDDYMKTLKREDGKNITEGEAGQVAKDVKSIITEYLPTQEDNDKGIGYWGDSDATPEQKLAVEKVKEYLTGKGYTKDSVGSLIAMSWGMAIRGNKLDNSGLIKYIIMQNIGCSVAEESAKAPWNILEGTVKDIEVKDISKMPVGNPIVAQSIKKIAPGIEAFIIGNTLYCDAKKYEGIEFEKVAKIDLLTTGASTFMTFGTVYLMTNSGTNALAKSIIAIPVGMIYNAGFGVLSDILKKDIPTTGGDNNGE